METQYELLIIKNGKLRCFIGSQYQNSGVEQEECCHVSKEWIEIKIEPNRNGEELRLFPKSYPNTMNQSLTMK